MFNTLIANELPYGVKITFLVIYILGFIFCLFIRNVMRETLKRSSKKTQYMVFFMIWLASPAIILGLLVVTIKTLFKNGNK